MIKKQIDISLILGLDFKMCKIIHLINSLRSGGAERQLLETLKFFKNQKNFSCEIVIMSKDIHYDYICDLDIKIYQISRKLKKDPSIFFQFYKIFQESKPDIVHSWSSMCSVYAILAVKLLGIKFVNGFLRDAPQKLNIKDVEWRRAKLTFPFSNVILANSYAGLKSYKVPVEKRICLRNGFDFSRTQDLDSKKMIRSRFDIQTSYVVGMVASFSDKKDYKTFVDAAHIVLEKRDDVTFVAIGDGKYFDEIKKRIKVQYQDKFRMAGAQKRVMNIVNIFDIGVLATYTEGISNVVMEYMALRKPVIVTDCEGIRELVEDWKTGFLTTPNNSGELAEKIIFLLANRSLAMEFGQKGCQKLKDEFSLEVMGASFSEFYKSLTMGLRSEKLL